jgi:hypothetical protein
MYYFFDFGAPIHRGVRSMYSWYSFPNVWRQYRSSDGMNIRYMIANMIVKIRKSHDALISDILTYIKRKEKYAGCLEYRYGPVVNG